MEGINTILSKDIEKNSSFEANQNKEKKQIELLAEVVEKIMKIDFHAKANKQDDQKIPEKIFRVITTEIVETICNDNGYGIGYFNFMPYIYTGQFWKAIDEELFKSYFLLQASLRLGVPEYTAKPAEYLKKLLEQAKTSLHKHKPENNENILINLQNGTFVFSSSKSRLREFRKEDFLTYQLPFEYDKDATCPIFQKFLNEVLPDKSKQLVLAEYLGYIFMKKGNPNVKKLEKALFLYGTGANGKSVIFEIVIALLGKENISTINLEYLSKEDYRAEIENKLLNYASETGRKFDPSIFKTLASGERITARRLYGKPFDMENYAKLIFNVNELPITSDKTPGFYRRFLIIHFDKTIPPDKRDRELAGKIIESELSGVFNWILEGMERLYKQKDFTHSKAIEDTLKLFKINSDNVSLYLDENDLIPCTTNFMLGKDMYDKYRNYCFENGNKPLGNNNFYNRLEDLGFTKVRKKEGNGFFMKVSENKVNEIEF